VKTRSRRGSSDARSQNVAHVTSYAHIGLAATLRADHELPQCCHWLFSGLRCRSHCSFLRISDDISWERQGRTLFQYCKDHTWSRVTTKHTYHPTFPSRSSSPSSDKGILSRSRFWKPLTPSPWTLAYSLQTFVCVHPLPTYEYTPQDPPPLISITVHFYRFSDPASNEKGHRTDFLCAYVHKWICPTLIITTRVSRAGSNTASWTRRSPEFWLASSGPEAEDNPGTARDGPL